jgi:hypothetical protein
MHIEPTNPIIKRFVQNFLTKGELAPEFAYDYDNVIYRISSDSENDRVEFSVKTNCSKAIFAHGGDAMLEELYPDYICPKTEYFPEFDVTMRISTKNLPQTKKIKKSMDEETANKIREENETIRVERGKITEAIADKVAQFKRNFLGAPIRQAMKAAIAQKDFKPAEIPYRQDEKYWVVNPAKDEVQVFFAINFPNEVDQALARVMLLEFQSACRNVKTPPSITYYDKEFPQQIQKLFPGSEKQPYTNGIISMSK